MAHELFWQVFAAVISANLLTVGCVWGMAQYSRLQREGRADDTKTAIYCAMFTPLAFAGLAVYAVLS